MGSLVLKSRLTYSTPDVSNRHCRAVLRRILRLPVLKASQISVYRAECNFLRDFRFFFLFYRKGVFAGKGT